MKLASTTLAQRLTLVFVLLLLACSAATVWLQMRVSDQREQEVVQRLSQDLAARIARYPELMRADGLNAGASRELFGKLMQVNPSVEVYLLDDSGAIQAYDAPQERILRQKVDLEPLQRLFSGAALPVLGDDPRSMTERKVFSAAPLMQSGQRSGYVYVILQGQGRDSLAARVSSDGALRTLLWSLLVVVVLGAVAAAVAFGMITRPLRRLTAAVQELQTDGLADLPQAQAKLQQAAHGGADIAVLSQAFAQLAQRTWEQWQKLRTQDQQRRELFANISHDLRTPLTSLHGYLETLQLKADVLSPDERRRYLGIALDQSRKVGDLAQKLFELARLEYGVVKPEPERFFLPDLLQDVFQKFELAAEAKTQRLHAVIDPDLPPVTADLGMLERVLVNLIDNAIRATPQGGNIQVELRAAEQGRISVTVQDNGPGIPPALRDSLFERPTLSRMHSRSDGRSDGRSGGLGLMIVHRILQLHDSSIELLSGVGDVGARFRFYLR
ncbi:HAMP domain-containing sensor histidine kinase [Comamonas sp.]|uniref:sensor histidine kinase n=1 Tax=Comamonas sp. TaxID=34028 RepID=UPI0028970CDC|nr:HAMP domain-containing sensor histidine kinase [Comamonas sp.]